MFPWLPNKLVQQIRNRIELVVLIQPHNVRELLRFSWENKVPPPQQHHHVIATIDTTPQNQSFAPSQQIV